MASEDRSAHDGLMARIQQTLEGGRWEVLREPHVVGNLRPDMVATDPNGETYVIEIKTGSQRAHLGAVAQVEAYRDAIGHEAKGVLVLMGDFPEQLDDVAERAGITIVHASPDHPESISGSLKDLFL